jgi:hypothetical protein
MTDARIDDNGLTKPVIARRLGSTPAERGSNSAVSCPDIFELASGDFCIVGTDYTQELDIQLPNMNAARAPYERTVVIPRRVLLDAFEQLNGER